MEGPPNPQPHAPIRALVTGGNTGALSQVLMRLPPEELTQSALVSKNFLRAAMHADRGAMDNLYKRWGRNRDMKANLDAKRAEKERLMAIYVTRRQALKAALRQLHQDDGRKWGSIQCDEAIALYQKLLREGRLEYFIQTIVPAARALQKAWRAYQAGGRKGYWPAVHESRQRYWDASRVEWMRTEADRLYLQDVVQLTNIIAQATTPQFALLRDSMVDAHRRANEADAAFHPSWYDFVDHRLDLSNQLKRVRRPEFAGLEDVLRNWDQHLPAIPPRNQVVNRYGSFANQL